MATEHKTLDQIRQRIDALDEQILQLISARARCAEEVAQTKQLSVDDKKTGKVRFYRPEREAQILRRMRELNPGPLRDDQVARIYRELISSCLAVEETLHIAFLGPQGTFTEAAVYKHFGHSVETCPMESIEAVFREVEAEQAHYGVVPVENSTEGVVTHTLDCFMDCNLSICGEVHMRINQNLLYHHDNWDELKQKVKRIYSHRQSLAQCRRWLSTHLPNVEQIEVNSNAQAAQRAQQEDDAVAIGPAAAAELYGLKIVRMNIEDQPGNTTRFLVIGSQKVAPSGKDKTTLLLSARNRPGSLYQLLQPLADNGVDMTRIESRPSRCSNWEYVFFMDIDGHAEENHLRTALKALSDEAELMKILGSYPQAVM